MSKVLRTWLILSLMASFFVVIPASPALAEPPITPGTWTGFFTRQVTITNSVPGVLIEAFGAARADLNLIVDSNGGVRGKSRIILQKSRGRLHRQSSRQVVNAASPAHGTSPVGLSPSVLPTFRYSTCN